ILIVDSALRSEPGCLGLSGRPLHDYQERLILGASTVENNRLRARARTLVPCSVGSISRNDVGFASLDRCRRQSFNVDDETSFLDVEHFLSTGMDMPGNLAARAQL